MMAKDAWRSQLEVDIVLAQLADNEYEVRRLFASMTPVQCMDFAWLLVALTGNLGYAMKHAEQVPE